MSSCMNFNFSLGVGCLPGMTGRAMSQRDASQYTSLRLIFITLWGYPSYYSSMIDYLNFGTSSTRHEFFFYSGIVILSKLSISCSMEVENRDISKSDFRAYRRMSLTIIILYKYTWTSWEMDTITSRASLWVGGRSGCFHPIWASFMVDQ